MEHELTRKLFDGIGIELCECGLMMKEGTDGGCDDLFGDAGYTDVDKRDEMKGKALKWHVALRRGKIKAMRESRIKDLVIAAERTKAQVRAGRVSVASRQKTISTIARFAIGNWLGTRLNCSA